MGYGGLTARRVEVAWNGAFTHVPIPVAVQGRKQVLPQGELWRTVPETTGQGPLVAPA